MHRPLAAGRIDRRLALILALLLFIGGSILGVYVQVSFFAILIAYGALNLFYTYAGKEMVIMDVFCIALGFVLRVVGGALAISVQASGWMMMTTFFLALFLGFGKRRNEIVISYARASPQHVNPLRYDIGYVNHVLISCGTISLISYALYTRDPSVIQRIGTNALMYTVPIVAFGLFRYTYLLWDNRDGDPTDLILHDWGMLIDIALWVLTIVFLIYLRE
jgi:4-hydroxybenzoate polyprenyltransferase